MGLLTAPLRSRFTLQSRLSYYDHETLQGIIQRTCGILEVPYETEGAAEIARRSRGTPRIANNLVNFCRDYAQQRDSGTITRESAAAALELLEIDARGLDEMDKQIIRVMAENYKGGPVGLGTIAVAVGEEAHTLEEVHEPYLIQEGYLQRTPQGRILKHKSLRNSLAFPKTKPAKKDSSNNPPVKIYYQEVLLLFSGNRDYTS